MIFGLPWMSIGTRMLSAAIGIAAAQPKISRAAMLKTNPSETWLPLSSSGTGWSSAISPNARNRTIPIPVESRGGSTTRRSADKARTPAALATTTPT